MGACGQVDRALNSRLEGLGFDSQCWPCVEMSGKLRIPHCLGPTSRNGYLVYRSKAGSIVAGCCAPTARGGTLKRSLKNMCSHMDIRTLNRYLYIYLSQSANKENNLIHIIWTNRTITVFCTVTNGIFCNTPSYYMTTDWSSNMHCSWLQVFPCHSLTAAVNKR